MTHVHFVGIGGSGLSAIARLLFEQGYTVTGSDRILSPLAADLQKAGITIYAGHAAENIRGADWLVRSSAVPDHNPEVVAALAAGLPVYKRADFLGRLMEDKIGIAVAGTHGKTTTTGMLAWVLTALGGDPSFIVGGVLQNLGVNARAGRGETFVIEADEYDRMFLGLKPRYAVVTNVEHDHPDCYPTPAEFRAAFESFAQLVPAQGALVACADDPGAYDLLDAARQRGQRVIPYRLGQPDAAQSEWACALNPVSNERGGFSFEFRLHLAERAPLTVQVRLSVPGLHNVRNALAVLTVIGLLNLDLVKAAQALGDFCGTGRRFEVKGESGGVSIIDDYAHHPTEIRATLSAARARYPSRRIWAVWQPHTYSRTQTLFDEFITAFSGADEVIVSEIYAAREPKQDFSARQVVEAMPHDSARFIPALAEISEFLISHLLPGDVVLVLSAGDADQVSAQVLAHLKESEANHG